MKLSTVHKLNKGIFRLLKISEITYQIGRTSKGNLGIRFNENSEDFEIVLDSLPLSTESIMQDENNIELKETLTRHLFDPESTIAFDTSSPNVVMTSPQVISQDKTVKDGKHKAKKAS